MATKHYENGIVGSSEGGSAEIASDIFVTGAVYWVDSVDGNDSNAGTNRNSPKATLASAYSSATANNGDIIIIESGHSESLGSSVTLSKAGVRIFGLGSGSNKPSFTVTANVDALDITAARQEINGLRFPVGTTTGNTSRVNIAAAHCRVVDCDFLCGQYDQNSITIPDAGDDALVQGCTFTISADGPDSGILVESATLLGLEIKDCSFDGGSYDFDDAAVYSAVAHTEYRYDGNTLTNKASIIHTAAAKGQVSGTVAGDTSRVEV